MLRKNKSVWLVLLAVLLIVFCGVRLYRVQAAQNNNINSNRFIEFLCKLQKYACVVRFGDICNAYSNKSKQKQRSNNF